MKIAVGVNFSDSNNFTDNDVAKNKPDSSATVPQSDEELLAALNEAVAAASVERVAYLFSLPNPPNPNLKIRQGSDYQDSPLDKAIGLGNAAGENKRIIIDLLIENGAYYRVHRLYIHTAIETDSLLFVRQLYEKDKPGERFHKGDFIHLLALDDGISPLMLAAAIASQEIVDFLVNHGAEAPTKELMQSTDVIKLLRSDLDQSHKILLRIIKKNNIINLQRLLSRCPELCNRVNKEGETPLIFAIRHDSEACIEVLIAAGADPAQKTHTNNTAFHAAVCANNLALMTRFFVEGTDINLKCEGQTPLYSAIGWWQSKTEIIQFLLDHKADPNIACNFYKEYEETPLYRAVKSAAKKTVRLLLKAGADPNARSSFRQQTPLRLVLQEGKEKIIEEFVAVGALDLTKEHTVDLVKAIKQGNLSVVKQQIEAGESVNKDERYGSLLKLAATSGHIEIVKFLVENGADPFGMTEWLITVPEIREYLTAQYPYIDQAPLPEPKETTLSQPYTTKPYLEKIQQRFSPPSLHTKVGSPFSLETCAYLFSTDYFNVANYFSWFDTLFSQPKMAENINLVTPRYNLCKTKRVGIIVGNGSILSLLPELPVEDILLTDTEPSVQHFALMLKKIILSVRSEANWDEVKTTVRNKIKQLEYFRPGAREPRELIKGLESEMEYLKEKHFLSSLERFRQCQAALRVKSILPVKLDLFNSNQMKEFSQLLKEENIKISFLNITNLADYDSSYQLIQTLSFIPLTKNCTILSTSILAGGSNREKCFIARNITELAQQGKFKHNRDKYENTRKRLCLKI